MVFRVKGPAPCAADCQTASDFVPMGNGRTLGYSVVEMKRAPISRRHRVPPHDGGSDGETGASVAYEHNGPFDVLSSLVTGNQV
jgi:hypothetical protein